MEKDRAYLRHMNDECTYLLRTCQDIPFRTIVQDPTLQRAVIRSIEVLGEASKNVSSHLKEQHPDIPWEDIAGIRDILAHRYFGVDWDVVADVVLNEIPRLHMRLETILTSLESGK